MVSQGDVESVAYLQSKGVPQLLDEMIVSMADQRPANARDFMVQYLRAKVAADVNIARGIANTWINMGIEDKNTWWSDKRNDHLYPKDRIRGKFFGHHEAAAEGAYDSWATNPLGVVALIVLLDQFPRQIFSGSRRAFETDAKALAITKAAVAAKLDDQLNQDERLLLYIPYCHSENLEDQRIGLALIKERISDASAHAMAEQTLETIEKFGRFLDRNQAMKRKNTMAESDYQKRKSILGLRGVS